MLLPNTFLLCPNTYALAAALYLDAYLNADGTAVILPRRSKAQVLSKRRVPHLTMWTDYLHKQYRELPAQLKLEQFVILDDGWASATLELLGAQFRTNLNAAARVAFHMWERILFWAQYGNHSYAQGFVTTYDQIAVTCGVSSAFAMKVVLALIEAGLIHRKWIGSGVSSHGSCYLAGPEKNLENLLESRN